MSAKKIPLRMCVGCGEMKPKAELIRVVRDKDGNISADPTGRAQGRGAYVCKDPACLEKARKARRLERSFSSEVPQSVFDTVSERAGEGK